MKTNQSRRNFLKGLAAAGALAVMPGAIARQVQDEILSGRVIGRTFYVSKTIRIVDDSVLIKNCTFIATRFLQGPVVQIESMLGATFVDCYIDATAVPGTIGVEILGNNQDSFISGYFEQTAVPKS